MDGEAKEKKLEEVTDRIVNEYKPKKIILFGSFAWGTPHKDSDFDLFIIKDTDERRIDREREVQKILWGTKFPVDILVYTSEEVEHRLGLEDFFVQNILKNGK